MDRRHFLLNSGLGLGALALSELERQDKSKARGPHFPPTAKRVIYLHMAGSPPAVDLLDPKPKLQKLNGTLCPKAFFEGKRLAFIKGHPTLLGSPFPFYKAGSQGLSISTLMPHLGGVIDELCLIRSMHTDQFNHAPAQLLFQTGSPFFGGASLGSWVSYGLGSLNQNLPTFVVMVSGGTDPSGGKSLWGSSYLPSRHQATRLRSRGDPVLYLGNPKGMDRQGRRFALDAIAKLNRLEHEKTRDPQTLARSEQYELAFRMQLSVPTVMDISREPQEVKDLYGAQPGKASFANNCLLARRLVEKGVRFVQLYDWGWDLHGTGKNDDLLHAFPRKCKETDRPVAALIQDLKRRGLLEDTLVIWGGEFGRTPMNEARNGSKFLGRDHHRDCFSLWMAGGGVKRGHVHGETDDLGYSITKDPVSVRDLQATILHTLGLDARKLSYPYMGLNQRLIGPSDEAQLRPELLS